MTACRRPRAAGPTTTLALISAALVVLAAALPSPAVAQSACGAFYAVRTGDSLLDIAERCGVTLPALLAANPGVRDRTDLEVGGKLRVPDPGARQPTPQEACGATYTVRTGDTLAEIARKCGLTIPLLVAANGRLPDPLGVHAGAVIRIPDLPPSAVRDTLTVTSRAAGPGSGSDSAAAAPARLTRVRGTLEAGHGCMRVRSADGVVAIDGDVGPGFRPGDQVVLLGVPAEGRPCGRSTTLELRILYHRAG